jgi:hypothetical protein
MLQSPQHIEFVQHHLLVALHVLLEDDLHGDAPFWAIGFSDDAIRAGAQRPA